MSSIEEGAKQLSKFGLTPYEAKVYIASVTLGTASASSISKLAAIRREEVYRTLPKLEKSGLVQRVMGRPVKVKALPLKDGLEILIKRKEAEAKKEISDLNKRMEEFLALYGTESRSLQLAEEETHFTLISEKESVNARITLLIKKAATSIDVVDSSDSMIRFALTYAESLAAAAERGVGIRLLTECPDDESKIPTTLGKHIPSNSFILRYVTGIPSRYVLFDGSQVMITTSAEGTLSESKCLWTNDFSMVGLISRDFEDLYSRSTDWEKFSLSSSEKLNRILERLKPRDHVVFFYDSIEAKHTTLFDYISQGLQQGQAAAYVCSEETPSEIKKAMKAYGIDVERYEQTGALSILNYTDVYIANGRFSLVDTMTSWEAFYDNAISHGFKGLRVTGEMSCFFKHSLVDELIEYEKALHTILDIPMTAICAYNSEILAEVERPIDVYSELVKAHGKVLFAGKDNMVGKLEIRKA